MKPAKRQTEQAQPAARPQTLPNIPEAIPEHSRLLIRREESSGPLPDPVTFQHYDEILPGAAERILTMAEENARHAREMDKAVLSAQVQIENEITTTQRMGQRYGIMAAAMAFGLAGYALFLGHPAVASILASTTVVGLVTVFVRGRIVADRIGRQQNRGSQDGHQN